MSVYNYRALISVPIAQLSVAQAIGQALDPDIGGDESFSIRATGAGGEYAVCDTPCVEHFAAMLQSLIGNAAALCYVVSLDYAERWADMVPPTLAECEAFVGAAKVWVGERECFGQGSQLDGVLAVWGMVRTVTELEA